MKQRCTSVERQPLMPAALWRMLVGVIGLCLAGLPLSGQGAANENLAQRVAQLTEAMTRTQAQLEQSQRELTEMRLQLAELRNQVAQTNAAAAASTSAAQLSAQVEEIREQQAMQESQIATHEQAKAESESKYPIKLSGLVLLSGFVNTRQVDMPATPSIVASGNGSTGATIRQTVFGLDARGPHLFNALSHADARVDFDGSSLSGSNGGAGAYTGGLLRLRTAHASLQWEDIEAFFSLDHPIVSPNTPSSLTAVAVPALAWSGNLWTWNPQVGVTYDIPLSTAQRLRMQTALIDVANPPAVYATSSPSTATIASPMTSEQSRWPGVESRFALVGAEQENGVQLGLSGFYAPHRIVGGRGFDSWATTLDYRVPLPAQLELSGSVYRGMALGGLGGGAFKDYVYRVNPDYPGAYYFRALDDVGGWTQLKERANEHLEFNLAFGMDNVPAGQLRPFAGDYTATYLNLARNRTYSGNVIYSPSTYLLFSLEYRHLESSPVTGSTAAGDVIGIATGYRF